MKLGKEKVCQHLPGEVSQVELVARLLAVYQQQLVYGRHEAPVLFGYFGVGVLGLLLLEHRTAVDKGLHARCRLRVVYAVHEQLPCLTRVAVGFSSALVGKLAYPFSYVAVRGEVPCLLEDILIYIRVAIEAFEGGANAREVFPSVGEGVFYPLVYLRKVSR